MSHSKFPSPATMASNAIKTGVEQGEEKIPPNIPVKNAPRKPRFLFLVIKLADGIKWKSHHVCSVIKTINPPRIMYHTGDEVLMRRPADVAITPSETKVIAVPDAKTTE